MATILTLSSQVIKGHVGNSASVFILQRLGHTVWPFHTTYFSNHPGYPYFDGEHIPISLLQKTFDVFIKSSALKNVDAILSGYLPTVEHVNFARHIFEEVKAANPKAYILCDPTMGDDPKGLYIDRHAAESVKQLIPLADLITPNRFELEWLSESPVHSYDDVVHACDLLPIKTVLSTSSPAKTPYKIDNHLREGSRSWVASLERKDSIPHGTGDCFAALFLGFLLHTHDQTKALIQATEGIAHILKASSGRDELDVIGTQGQWAC
ncbi:MAG: pyridoxal kinase [Pseudomonadota bacterium]